MSAMPTKAEMKQQLDEAKAERDDLKVEISRINQERDDLTQSVLELEEELTAVREKLDTAQAKVDKAEETVDVVVELEDRVEKLQWEQEEVEKIHELTLVREKESLRNELTEAHKKELEARDYLIQMLTEKVSLLQGGETKSDGSDNDPSKESGMYNGHCVAGNREQVPGTHVYPHTSNEGGFTHLYQPAPTSSRARIATLSPFNGNDGDDPGGFPRWLRKLERMAELHSWSDREKLIQFELLLTGRAEKLYELLPGNTKVTFQEATSALKRRLEPVGRDALRSAQLIRRRQRGGESIDTYAQDFERLFEQSYGCRTGMDNESRNMLKRDLFVQGLLLKWQEKVLPSAEMFADALYQARAIEEQTRQLATLHGSGVSRPRGREADKEPEPNIPKGPQKEREAPQGRLRCHKCHSTKHLLRDCPMRKKPDETPGRVPLKSTEASSYVVTGQTTDERHCEQLHQQWADAEYQRIKQSLQVDTVTGSVGPLYYCHISVAGQPVTALVDSGSSATIMSLELFQEVAKQKGLSSDVLKKPDVVLRDYNHNPLRVGAVAHLDIEYRGKVITAPVYINAGRGQSLEPFLCGTNVLFPLGLLSVDDGVTARGGTEQQSVEENDEVSTPVKLLRTERIPGWSAAILRVSVETGQETGTMHYIPSDRSCVVTEESVICVKDGQATLPILNYSRDPVKLNPSYELGNVVRIVEEGDSLVTTERLVEKTVNSYSIVATNRGSDTMRRDALKRLLEEKGSAPVREIVDTVLKHHDVFSLEENERGCVKGVEHAVDTADHPPIRQPPHRVPFALCNKISEMVRQMMDEGIVKESSSPWASPVVIVKKKDSSLRFCVDYRRLNAITRKDVFPLPRIDDLLDQLSGKTVFTTLDAKRGYWQIKVEEQSRPKTAFVTHEGLYEFQVMPFGLCNAPATFQRVMQRVLSGYDKFCNVYIDDILVFSRNLEEHKKHLELVFERLSEYNLKLHPTKCQLARAEVEYLGHVVSAEGVAPNPAKIQAVESFPIPTNVRAVREFLGLCSYYRKFVPGFSKIATPLHQLLKADARFLWTESCQNSFQKLKEVLIHPPVLAYPDFEKPFVLHTDASGEGLGAVLEQKQEDNMLHPVAYASRTLNKHEKKYGITELEALGVIWALRHFRAYLWGHHCTVFTDHAPVRSLLYNPKSTGKLARWSDVIAEFDIDIQYKPGRQNSNADALSRSPLETMEGDGSLDVSQVANITATEENQEWITSQQSDPLLAPIIKTLTDGGDHPNYILINGLLHHGIDKEESRLRVCVPTKRKEELLRQYYSGPFAGHFSHKALYRTLARQYWWKGMYRDALAHCKSCLTCATYGGSGKRLKPTLKPIPVGGPFHRVGVDIMELPLTTNGNKYVVVFMDYLTKWVEAFAVADQTSETIATLLIDEVICRHGVPELLLSDRGANLLSNLMKEICELTGIKKINTTASHPQTDGLVENFNRTLRAMVTKYSAIYGTSWDVYLPKLLFAYRTKCHESTQESPFFLLYGRDPRIPIEETLSFERSPYTVDLDDYKLELTSSLANAWKIAGTNIEGSQERQKRQYDKKAKDRDVRTGDRVMVYMPKEATGKERKMARPHFGPYRVIEVHTNGVTVRPVDRPKDAPIRVNMDRISICSDDLPNVSWLGKRRQSRK